MSILSSSSNSSKNNSNNNNMGTPFLHEFKKQASFFLKEKIKTARLALTDVTPAELWTEEVTNGNSWAPDAKTMGLISRAAFEVDDYWRIVEILHNRLSKFDRKNWRVSYNSIILLEHLLTHGPESAAEEFQTDKDVFKEMESFQHIDDKGFNWGLAVRKKSERVSKLLEKGPLLKEERERVRKISRGIQGFGSFSAKSSSSGQGILKETSFATFGRRCNSQFNDHENQEDQYSNDENSTKTRFCESQKINEDQVLVSGQKMENLNSSGRVRDAQKTLILDSEETSLKENMAPKKAVVWKSTGEAKPLLGDQIGASKIEISIEEDHPFNDTENQATSTLLFTSS